MASLSKVMLVSPSSAGWASSIANQLQLTTPRIDSLFFVGIDAEKWQDMDKVGRWVAEFNETLQINDKDIFLLTTVVVLAWPETLPGSLKDYERFRHLLLSGCKLRYKHAAYYRHGSQVTEEEFEADISDAGWIRATDSASPPVECAAPKFENDEEIENYKQRLEFYGNPPFRWGPAEKKAIFPNSP